MSKICRCGETMDYVGCDDRNQQIEPDYNYNLYQCSCGKVCFADIHNSKDVWIDATDTTIEIIPKGLLV